MMIYANVGKSKQKQKPRKEREEYAAWLDKHKVSSSKPKKAKPDTNWKYTLSVPAERSTKNIPSLNSGMAVAPAKPIKVYTGGDMIGIGQLHKSNAIPIFRKQDAEDLARMRR